MAEEQETNMPDAMQGGEAQQPIAGQSDQALDEGHADLAVMPDVLSTAIDDMGEAASAFSYAGAVPRPTRPDAGVLAHGFVAAGDDPRDAELREVILDESVAWQGSFFDVHRLETRLPDERSATRDVVRHPGAVAIVALTDDGRICLVRQYRAALDRVTVEIPAGKLDPGEDPLDCARRELREETGMVAERMAFLTTIATSVGFCDELIHLYMATGLTFAEASPDEDEFINVDLVDLRELVDAVLDGRVEDVKTVTGALICDAISRRLGVAS